MRAVLHNTDIYSVFSETAADDPMQANGYLTGNKVPGVAYSDRFKMFKFLGSDEVWAKCNLKFCMEEDDPRCITVS